MADNNDWRVTITLADRAHADRVRGSFAVHTVAADVQHRLGRDIAVSAGDGQVFLYAGSELAAQEAERVARDVLASNGVTAELELHRWHPVEEEWQRPDVALPRTDAERTAEHQRLEDEETAESLASGLAQWEARAEFPSHHEAVALAAKLRGEGLAVVRRWRFLVVFANDEDDAAVIASRIRQEAPADATVRVQTPRAAMPFLGY